MDRYQADRKHSLYCSALTAATAINIANAQGGSKDRVKPEDLIGGESSKHKKQDWQYMKMLVENVINPAFDGKDLRNG